MAVLRNEQRLVLQKPQMSTGPSGGGGSDNVKYYVLVGATCLGGAVYVSVNFFLPVNSGSGSTANSFFSNLVLP